MSEETEAVHLPEGVYLVAPQVGMTIELPATERLVAEYAELVEDDSPFDLLVDSNAATAHALRKVVKRRPDTVFEASVVHFEGALRVVYDGDETILLFHAEQSLVDAKVEGEYGEWRTGLISAGLFTGLETWNPEEHRLVEYSWT